MGIVAVLAAIHLGLRLAPLPGFPGDTILRYVVDFNDEDSVVTWLSAVVWLLAAGVAVGIGVHRRASRAGGHRWWFAFALVPLAISLDEVASVHERSSQHVRALFGVDGALYFAWVIPVALLAVVLAAVFLRFFLRLPAWLRARIFLAAALAAGGALGLEVVGSAVLRSGSPSGGTDLYILLTTLEETLELLGGILLGVSLLEHLARLQPVVTFVLEPSERAMRPVRPDARPADAGSRG